MEKEKLKPGFSPFVTSNAALAFALYSAGVPFMDPRHPCRNIYTEESVFRIGGGRKDDDGNVIRASRYAGLSFEAAIEQAFSENKKGHVEYYFQRPKGLKKLCEAFAAQEREFNEKDVIGAELLAGIMNKIADGTITQQEGLLRLACVNLKMRSAFMDLWKKQIPMARIDNPGKVVSRKLPGGGRRDIHPGFKIVNINLSEQKRKQIGL
jgi:hypothetical protein